jgi:hypothetical protein
MVSRAALLCLLAAMLPAGCNRTDVPPSTKETGGQKAAEPTGDHPKGDRLARPVPVEVDGKPLVREGGALVPFVGDFDGDGRQDLLLGEGARLLIH